MNVSKTDFQAYEGVRQSGVTNMFDIKMVMKLSLLSRGEVIEIMHNYRELCDKYPEVRKL